MSGRDEIALAGAGDGPTSQRMTHGSAPPDLTIYYDGDCPICAWEIAQYNKLRGSGRLHWLDINTSDDAALGPGLNREDALGKFHVRDASGTLVTGGAAFVEIWKRLPAMRWAARLGGTAVGRWVLERAYRVFLRILPRLRRWMTPREVA